MSDKELPEYVGRAITALQNNATQWTQPMDVVRCALESAITRYAEERVAESIREPSAILRLRGIRPWVVCAHCRGAGTYLYGSTATWRGGIGGAAMTLDVCDVCWGSGDKSNPWLNLREMRDRETDRVAARAASLLADAAGANFNACRNAINELCGELDKLARGRKQRPRSFYEITEALAKTLRRAAKAEP